MYVDRKKWANFGTEDYFFLAMCLLLLLDTILSVITFCREVLLAQERALVLKLEHAVF